ncbi:MAG: phosphoglycerate kinase, partial [Pseudomonadota bacterium]|nr:phosphoglycerate kinase [Pseudomonadota bacterium]
MRDMNDVALAGKRVLIREDLNVPLQEGRITSDTRIRAALPTILAARNAGAKVILMSHLGRPKEGEFDVQFSLAPVATRLGELLKQPVRLISDFTAPLNLADGEVVLLENVRFTVGEKSNDATLSRRLAKLCDVFVMDAFATAHRAQASTTGVAEYAPIACAGPLLIKELSALNHVLDYPARPFVAIVGGAKVSDKLTVLTALAEKVDRLIVGGGIANTFLAAAGFPIGKSLHEPELIKKAKALLSQVDIPLQKDVVVSKTFSSDAPDKIKNIADVEADDMIFDVGPETAARFQQLLQDAGTIVWNGPMGVFEWPAFAEGTEALARAVA